MHGLFPLKGKIGIRSTNAFSTSLDESNCKPSKV